MKKLLKNEICGSVNSVQCALIGWKLFDKSNFAATVHTQCINSAVTVKFVPKRVKKKRTEKRKRKRKRRTQMHTNSLLLMYKLGFMV